MDFRRRANWLIALLEQSDIYRRPRGLWMFVAAGATADQNSQFASGSGPGWFATGLNAESGQHDDLPFVQSGLHARKPFTLVDCEVSRVDVRSEIDSALGGARFRERFPPKVAA